MIMDKAVAAAAVISTMVTVAASLGLDRGSGTVGKANSGVQAIGANARGGHEGRERFGRIVAATDRGIIIADPETGKSETLLDGAGSNPHLSPDGRTVAFDRGGVVWLCASEGGASLSAGSADPATAQQAGHPTASTSSS